MNPNLRWGAASNPLEAAAQLNLIKYLDAVPQYGSVVDIGAGIAHGMEALLYVRRPDLTVASVDPRYALQSAQEQAPVTQGIGPIHRFHLHQTAILSKG